MFLFSRLEKAAKVESLFKPGKAARTGGGGGSPPPGAAGPNSSTGGGGGGADGGGGGGAKASAPDVGALSNVFQGMVDPTPAQKAK